MNDSVEGLRQKIDAIDDELVALLNRRAACALRIAEVKRELGLPTYLPDREAEILKRVEGANAGPFDGAALRRLFQQVINECRRLERIGRSAE